MARETALWERVRDAGRHLARCGFGVHLERIENDVGIGHPDVDGCIAAQPIKIELKSGERPAKISSKIKIRTNKRTKAAQDIWHTKRHRSGSRHHWVLVQVGDAHEAKHYLVPGRDYIKVYGSEPDLERLAVNKPTESIPLILLRSIEGYE